MKTFLLLALAIALPAVAANPFDASIEVSKRREIAFPHLDNSIRLGSRSGVSPVRRWNQIAIDASGLDHMPVRAGETRVFGEQLGPCRAARAMAIVHIAMLDSINAMVGAHKSYTGVRARATPVSLDLAVSQAAHDTLVALFPSQAARFDAYLAADLAGVKNNKALENGIALGQRVAATLLTMRAEDGSEIAEPRVGIEHLTSNDAGRWRQDPISHVPLALGAKWGQCKPFVMQSGSQFRLPPPPAMDSPEYAVAYSEAKRLGG